MSKATGPLVLLQSPAPEGDAPYAALAGFLSATVLFLVLDVWTAKTGRRRLHVTSALITVPIFLLAVYYADTVGRWWNFDRFFLAIHITLAKTGFVMAFVTVISGGLHLYGKLGRRAHRGIAYLFLSVVVLASVTGFLIFVTGEPKVASAKSLPGK